MCEKQILDGWDEWEVGVGVGGGACTCVFRSSKEAVQIATVASTALLSPAHKRIKFYCILVFINYYRCQANLVFFSLGANLVNPSKEISQYSAGEKGKQDVIEYH